MNGKRNIGAILILFLTAAIWGSSFVFQKYAVEQLPAAFIVAGRFTIAGILLLVITLLAVQHNAVDKLGNQNGIILRIGQNLSLGNITSSGHFASLLHKIMISSVLESYLSLCLARGSI